MPLFKSKNKDSANSENKKSSNGKSSNVKTSNTTNYKPKNFFHISKPYGYVPEDVDNAIVKYNDLLAKQKTIIMKLKDENSGLKNEIQKLENEIRDMQMELSFTTIPTVTSIQEKYILDKFDQSFQSDPAPQKSAQINTPSKNNEKANKSQTHDSEEVFDVDELLSSENNEKLSHDEDILNNVVGDTYNCESDTVFDIPGFGTQKNDEDKVDHNVSDDDGVDDFEKKFGF